MLAPTPCLECSEHAVYRGRCETHRIKRWEGSTRKSRLPGDWSTRRLIVLKRDKRICYLCGGEDADTVDHVIPGDDHSLNNLKAVHDAVAPHCHRHKTALEGARAMIGNRTKQRH